MSIFRSKFSIFAACACMFLSCTPPTPKPVGKVTLTIFVSARPAKTGAFHFDASYRMQNDSDSGSRSKAWGLSGQPYWSTEGQSEGHDFKVEDPKMETPVAVALLRYSAKSAEVKTELTRLPDMELVLNTKGGIPLVIKDKDGALLKAPVKVPAGKTVYTIAPANP